jgi:hypothetical protein
MKHKENFVQGVSARHPSGQIDDLVNWPAAGDATRGFPFGLSLEAKIALSRKPKNELLFQQDPAGWV